MSAPSNPTLTEIVTEGLNKAGDTSPTATRISQASTEWMEEIKNIIRFEAPKISFLQITAHGILIKGQSRYSYPTDFNSDLSVTLLDGNLTGTAQAGTDSTITLGANDNYSVNDILGKDIIITSGTGIGSLSQAIGYDNSTKVLSVAPVWNTPPSSGSTYMFVDVTYPVDSDPVSDYDRFQRYSEIGRPTSFYPMGDEDYGEFVFNRPPDKAYPARLRYYANLQKIDLTGNLMSTLYQRWRSIFVDGIFVKKLQYEDDSRADAEYLKWIGALRTRMARETYGKDVNDLQQRVSDYR